MPAKKGIKKVIKKKNVKKSIRNKLAKDKAPMTISDPTFINTPGASPIPSSNQANNISQLHGPNSLRAQLLARAAFGPTLGYMPQQYGNINTEKRIEQLRTDNQTNQQQISNDKVTIKTMEEEIKEQKKQIKELKKQRKAMESDYDKAQHEREMTEDQLHERERIENKTKREEQRKQIAELQMAEQTRKNEIIKYKTEADSMESQVHNLKLTNQQLQDKYDKNKEYQRLQQLQEEYKYLVNENATLMDIMKEDSFTKPNEGIIRLQKDIMKAQYEKELNEEKIKKQKELNEIQIQTQTIPQEELEAITKQHVDKINELHKEILNAKEEYMPYQTTIDEYEYSVNQLKQLNNQLSEAYNKHTMLQKEAEILETKNKGELGVLVKGKLEAVVRQKVINDANERRIERANQVARMKESDYQNQLMINELNKGINETEQTQIKQLVTEQAKEERQKRQMELLQQQKESQIENTRNAAIIEAMKEEIPKEELDQIKSNAVAEIKNNENKRYMSALQQYRETKTEEAKSNAEKEYLDSKDYNKLLEERAAKEIETARIMKQKEEHDLYIQSQRKFQEMKMLHEINNEVMKNSLSSVEQFSYILDNKLTPTMDEWNEKAKVVHKIYNLRDSHTTLWEAFIAENNAIPGMLDNYMNEEISDLNKILAAFQEVINKPNTNITIPDNEYEE